ncbi:hypothetical protein BU23DRAFT_597227 [Bimuria novae-zelandiae CBS 107.79]|uniref:Peptidase S8/S53 domain-containing protein n=1 Tax=Bimuria novae-zelandiae CBS 107.79 TaxID=1447943 RepID=A0A6A5VH88_9PLEO|nr:hypothetical protein BU23DRAFT_597227 [Bimuria novae-zelandiae CBS 107.79]
MAWFFEVLSFFALLLSLSFARQSSSRHTHSSYTKRDTRGAVPLEAKVASSYVVTFEDGVVFLTFAAASSSMRSLFNSVPRLRSLSPLIKIKKLSTVLSVMPNDQLEMPKVEVKNVVEPLEVGSEESTSHGQMRFWAAAIKQLYLNDQIMMQVDTLHEKEITGKGIKMAVIDRKRRSTLPILELKSPTAATSEMPMIATAIQPSTVGKLMQALEQAAVDKVNVLSLSLAYGTHWAFTAFASDVRLFQKTAERVMLLVVVAGSWLGGLYSQPVSCTSPSNFCVGMVEHTHQPVWENMTAFKLDNGTAGKMSWRNGNSGSGMNKWPKINLPLWRRYTVLKRCGHQSHSKVLGARR